MRGHKACGQIVTHAIDHDQLSSGNGNRGNPTTADMAHRVVRSVDDQDRRQVPGRSDSKDPCYIAIVPVCGQASRIGWFKTTQLKSV